MSHRAHSVWRRRGAAILLALGATIVSACGASGTTQPTFATVAGSYSLRTINGGALPWVNPSNTSGNKVEIMGAQLHLGADGLFSESWQYRITSPGGVGTSADAGSGSFTLLGSTLVLLHDTNSVRENGTFQADRLTVTTQGGSTLVYARQP